MKEAVAKADSFSLPFKVSVMGHHPLASVVNGQGPQQSNALWAGRGNVRVI